MKITKFFTIALSSVFALTACTDSFLDKVPDERTEIITEKKVVQLLTSAYPSSSYMWLSELMSDNIIDNQAPHLPTSPDAKQTMSKYNYAANARWDDQIYRFESATMATYNDWDSPGQLWSSYYSSIATVNHALEAMDKIVASNGGTESEVLKAARAEALLIRAYSHFMLAQLFSPAYMNKEKSSQPDQVGVPYVTEVEDQVRKNYSRGTVYDTYMNIKKDLEAALPNISDRNYNKPKWHFNVNAAHAFAARFYLTIREYEKVIEHANAVLGTDIAQSAQYTTDYSRFTNDLSYLSDFAKVWQSPEAQSNLMLLATYSIHYRRTFGYRYSCAGPAARAAFMYTRANPLFGAYPIPAFSMIGFTAASSSASDYGMTTSKIGEEFEYSDKIAGIGYPHIIITAFTGNVLLLERAEAKCMLGDLNGAAEDLMAYWNNGIDSFDEEQIKSWVDNNRIRRLTNDDGPYSIQRVYGRAKDSNANIIMDWSFTSQYISPDFVVTAEMMPYMNCINEFRRYETALQGMRFFDLKRWGMEYSHTYAQDGVVNTITLKGDDPRRAIELPWETLASGMESSRPTVSAAKKDILKDDKAYVVK